MRVTFDSTILGGLPVEVTASIIGAEPDVGIMSESADIEMICFHGRRRKRDGKWIKGSPVPPKVFDRAIKEDGDDLIEQALGA